MARLHRHFETSDPTPSPAWITETTEQDHRVYQETTMCECGCDISTRHIERHRRSKSHAHQMNWRQSVIVAHLQSTVTQTSPVPSTQPSVSLSLEEEDRTEEDPTEEDPTEEDPSEEEDSEEEDSDDLLSEESEEEVSDIVVVEYTYSDLIDALDDFRYNYLVAGSPVATCIFYNDYCEYVREKYQGNADPLSFGDVDLYMTGDLEIVSLNDEYCP
jgi:hypothetical protein